jgi:acyl-CoA synthetase (AMP-forming)/AMP-acid ligase II
MARTVFGDHSRYIETYLSAYKGYYFTGDGVNRDEDGYYWITGRVDGECDGLSFYALDFDTFDRCHSQVRSSIGHC